MKSLNKKIEKLKLSDVQIEGICFIRSVLEKRKAVYLADAPGFGKTLQAIAVMSELKAKKVIYVCPKSLIPQIKEVFGGFPDIMDGISVEIVGYTDFRNYEFAEIYSKRKYDLCILDEAHSVKNQINGGLTFYDFTKQIFQEIKKEIQENHNRKKKKKIEFVIQTVGTYYAVRGSKKFLYMSGTAMTKDIRDLFIFLRLAGHEFAWTADEGSLAYYQFCKSFMKVKRSPFGTSFYGIKKNMEEVFQDGIKEVLLRREHADETNEALRVKPTIYKNIPIAENKIMKSAEKYVREKLEKASGVDLSDPKSMEFLLNEIPGFESFSAFRESQGFVKIKTVVRTIKKDKLKKFILFTFHKKIAESYLMDLREAGLSNIYLITGKTPLKRRFEIVSKLNKLDEAVIISTYGAIGTGFDLNKFRFLLRTEYDWSLAIYDQSEGRIQRKGSGLQPVVYDFLAPSGAEVYLLKVLTEKRISADLLRKKNLENI